MLGTRSSRRRWLACAAAGALLLGLMGPGAATVDAAGVGRTYTLDADFDAGLLVGLNHNAPGSNQLQLNTTSSTFPFIWVANSAENTISKLDTVTGTELGRYKTGADGTWRDPSRTTVDLDGNVWVGNRASNTVTKVGLLEAGNCIDKNGNGTIETSTGGADVKAWPNGGNPADECILLHVTLPTPGASVRSVAIDSDNNVWAGLNDTGRFHKIDGATGAILHTIHNQTDKAYGAVVDPDGNLWIANQEWNYLTKYNPTTNTIVYYPIPHFSYGLGMDNAGNIWVSGWTSNVVSKVRRSDGAVLGTYPVPGGCQSRGVAVEQNGDVWVANSCSHTVGHLGNDGSNKGFVTVGNQPTGVAIDAAGMVWVTNLGSNNTTRVDPATSATSTFAVGAGPYNYSDMTGFVVRNLTSTVGTWTTIHDSGDAGTVWGTLDWNGTVTPGDTDITARVRAADSVAALGAQTYVSVNDGALFGGVTGRYIQIEMTLSTDTNGLTPVLADVTVMPEVCDPALLWKAPLGSSPADVSLAGNLDIKFTWGGCGNFVRDESVIIMIVDRANYYPITAWVYGADIVIDDVAEEYRQQWVPSWYGLSPGQDLVVQVYINYWLVGEAPIHMVP
ncbi:MAG: hypothetical protein K0R39_256 [Symbiobacteriaceae bacterium]|jgi:streptogramin lyase|nr:hypothetical protein [Symbiobacteriaceae bacterium]